VNAPLAAELARLPRPERRAALQAEVVRLFRAALLMEPGDLLPLDANYVQLGVTSLLIVNIKQDLEALLGCEVDAGELFGGPTVAQVVEHLVRRCPPALFGVPVAVTATAPGAVKPLVDRLIAGLYES
jgi:acyl carrier protein